MFKEYDVVYRAKVMVSRPERERSTSSRLHYLMASVADGIEGMLVGSWQLQTLTTAESK